MSHTMKVLPFDALLKWILTEYRENNSIFGIPRSLFYRPDKNYPYSTENLYGQFLASPVGPAAGPHTQLSQNIISAWLSGGRFIELKTVQAMDDLEIPRPCIDMEDEGYNVEWSQELQLEQSANEYIKAWALIHVLHHLLDFTPHPVGTVFNMSVGYNLEGIQSPSMTRFMNRLSDASEEIARIREVLRRLFPEYGDIEIPEKITNNVTLSTMHGCPPEEIEGIARFLMEKRGLNTLVKLNPTLLGKERVLDILKNHLGFYELSIPDKVFEQDIKYKQAVEMIERLKKIAREHNLAFGVKLSNTLAMENHKGILPGAEMYMSGRPLYPVTMNLFYQLSREFNGDLTVSYSAGGDALNVTEILASGANTVTVASDLLKPGGYSRLRQYLDVLHIEMDGKGCKSLKELTQNKLENLEQEASEALKNPRYKKNYHPFGLPKTPSKLSLFDCVAAPCVAQCAVCQDVPGYARLIADGNFDGALEVILSKNPLPGVSGYMCTHLCQTRCTRNNYDQPVAIRALKRFAAEKGRIKLPAKEKGNKRTAIIGSGPSGLSAAYFLTLNGIEATVFEAKERAGGMPSLAPSFRIPPSVIQEDIARITEMGVKIELSHPVLKPPEELLKEGFDAVYIASGFPEDTRLRIDGIEGDSVFSALHLLEQVSLGNKPDLGSKVLVIGGGNTAMDAARTARRLTGNPATVVYRRTSHEMPAAEEEKTAFLAEGNILEELASPSRVIRKEGRLTALECVKNMLSERSEDGRKKPVPISGSEFQIEADTIIIAVGQSPRLPFLNGSIITRSERGTVIIDQETGRAGDLPVFAGGDVVRGPSIIIQACADGRRAAESICRSLGIGFDVPASDLPRLSPPEIMGIKDKRARKQALYAPEMIPGKNHLGFDPTEQTYKEEEARLEAGRCLQCADFCDKCVEVCPNRANYAFFVSPQVFALPVLSCQNGHLSISGEESFQVEQNRQIIHVDDFCNECGNCSSFCVHQGSPYRDKPRLFLKEADFSKEDDNAFYIEGNTLRRREKGLEWRLSCYSDEWCLENSQVSINFSPEFQKVEKMSLKSDFEGMLSLKEGGEMAVILMGVASSLPQLRHPVV